MQKKHFKGKHHIDFNLKHNDLAQDQFSIGWQHVMKARFSKGWSIEHDKHLKTKKTQQKHNLWISSMKKIGIAILQWVHKLWTIRNEELHGRDKTEKQEQLRENMT